MEKGMGKQHIVILGGCGQVGIYLVHLLLDHTDFFITITSFHKNKVDSFDNKIDSKYKERIKVVYADTKDIVSLRDAFRNARLVVVSITANAFSQNIIAACLEEGCDYLDILEPEDVVNTLLQNKKNIEKNKRLFIAQGGMAPGMLAVLARFINERYNEYKKIRIGLIVSLKKSSKPEHVYDLFDFTLRNKAIIYRNGKWEPCNGKKAKSIIDYGNRFGKVVSIPINFYELDDLPGKFGLENFSCYGAITNIHLYFILKSLLDFLYKIKPGFGWYPLAKLLLNQSKKNKNEPEGFAIVIDAWKREMNNEPELKMIMEHRDNYYMTAVVTMLFIKEYLAGKYNQLYGVHLMGHIASTGILDKLSDFGLRLDIVEK